jgi:hypothetical protein
LSFVLPSVVFLTRQIHAPTSILSHSLTSQYFLICRISPASIPHRTVGISCFGRVAHPVPIMALTFDCETSLWVPHSARLFAGCVGSSRSGHRGRTLRNDVLWFSSPNMKGTSTPCSHSHAPQTHRFDRERAPIPGAACAGSSSWHEMKIASSVEAA